MATGIARKEGSQAFGNLCEMSRGEVKKAVEKHFRGFCSRNESLDYCGQTCSRETDLPLSCRTSCRTALFGTFRTWTTPICYRSSSVFLPAPFFRLRCPTGKRQLWRLELAVRSCDLKGYGFFAYNWKLPAYSGAFFTYS